MIVTKIKYGVEVCLSVEDCQMLAEACELATEVEIDSMERAQDYVYFGALGAALKAAAIAGHACSLLTPQGEAELDELLGQGAAPVAGDSIEERTEDERASLLGVRREQGAG